MRGALPNSAGPSLRANADDSGTPRPCANVVRKEVYTKTLPERLACGFANRFTIAPFWHFVPAATGLQTVVPATTWPYCVPAALHVMPSLLLLLLLLLEDGEVEELPP